MTDLVQNALSFVLSPAYLDLTMRQLAILGVVTSEREPLRVRDLAVGGDDDTLEQHGFVVRQRGDDGRDRFVAPTDAGLRFRQSVRGLA